MRRSRTLYRYQAVSRRARRAFSGPRGWPTLSSGIGPLRLLQAPAGTEADATWRTRFRQCRQGSQDEQSTPRNPHRLDHGVDVALVALAGAGVVADDGERDLRLRRFRHKEQVGAQTPTAGVVNVLQQAGHTVDRLARHALAAAAQLTALDTSPDAFRTGPSHLVDVSRLVQQGTHERDRHAAIGRAEGIEEAAAQRGGGARVGKP